MFYLNIKHFKHWIYKIESAFLFNRSKQANQTLMNKLIDISEYENQAISLAVKLINEGSVVAVPTDTVYGLAADAQNSNAIDSLYNIKGRDLKKPIAICTHCVNDICNWGKVGHLPFGLLEGLLPGPVTVILQRTPILNSALNPYQPNIAIRVPNSGFVCSVVSRLKKPIALTSANESDKPSTLKPIEFLALWPKLDAIFDGGTIGCSLELRKGSTIVDLTIENRYSIIRTGSALLNTLRTLHEFGLKEL